MKKRIWLTSLVALSTITPTAFLVTSCNNELTKEQVEKGTEISVENVGNLKPNEVTKDNVKVTKQPKDWEVTVKDLKINNDTVEVTLEAKKGNKTYTFTKTLTGFKKEVTELTEEEVKQQTEITVDKISETKAKDVTADKVKITKKPEKWEITIKSVKANANTIEVTLEAKKNDKTYTFTKTLTGFKVEKGELDKDAAKFTIKDASKDKLGGEISKEDINIENLKDDYKSEIDSIKYDGKSDTVTLTVKQTYKNNAINGTFEVTIKGFANVDKYLKLMGKNTKKELTEAEVKNHYASEFGDQTKIGADSNNSKYKYDIEKITYNDLTGTLTLEIDVKNSGNSTIGSFVKTITGFKKKLPMNKEDADISIKNLEKNKYNTKNAGDIKESEIDVKSKSGKYKYTVVGLEPNDKNGNLNINIRQQMLDGTTIATIRYTLEGFKKITEADLNDVNVNIEGLDPSKYSTMKASEVLAKHMVTLIKSKSGKYMYNIVESKADDTNGKIVYKLQWAIKNGSWSTETITYELTGFQK